MLHIYVCVCEYVGGCVYVLLCVFIDVLNETGEVIVSKPNAVENGAYFKTIF